MSALRPGFAEPVADAQDCFRAVLDALARPGTIQRAGNGLTAPLPLGQAAAATLLMLADADTPLWLDPMFAAARPWLAFHAGAPFAAALDVASFVHASTLPDLEMVRCGSDEAPEDGATVILEVRALGEGAPLTLAGPGLAAPSVLLVAGLPDHFAAAWAANHALYPRGIDLILTCGPMLAALPRSVSVG